MKERSEKIRIHVWHRVFFIIGMLLMVLATLVSDTLMFTLGALFFILGIEVRRERKNDTRV
jgi:hypothetical protein